MQAAPANILVGKHKTLNIVNMMPTVGDVPTMRHITALNTRQLISESWYGVSPNQITLGHARARQAGHRGNSFKGMSICLVPMSL